MKCFTCAVPRLPSLVGWQADAVLGITRLRLCGLKHLPTVAYLLHTADLTQMCVYQAVNLRVFSRHRSVPELPLLAQVRVPGTKCGQTNPKEQRKVHCRALRVAPERSAKHSKKPGEGGSVAGSETWFCTISLIG